MSRYILLLCAAPVVALTACEPPSDFASELESGSQAIYYGTRDPENVTLSEGQKLAIGWFYTPGRTSEAWCSGTLIAPRVVASAEHCLQGIQNLGQVGFGVGTMPSSPAATFSIAAVHVHNSLDAALFVLSEDATARVPSLVPIPANRQHPNAWLNQKLDASGYGETHNGAVGRFFAGVWLESIASTTVEVNGRGVQGICFGDSGGPLLAPGPVVVAVESYGDANCVGKDTMVRLDTLAAWIDPILAAQGEVPDSCDGLDYLGRCRGHIAEWCEDNQVKQYDCSTEGKTCGYIDDEIGYYCVEVGTDACGGLDYLGRCNGHVAEWCAEGQIQRYDCEGDGLTCGFINNEVGYYCVDPGTEDPCGGLTSLGRCNGTVAEWCEDDQLMHYDCAIEDKACGYIDEVLGYHCLESPGNPDDDGGGGGSGIGTSCAGCQTTGAPTGLIAWLMMLLALLFVSRRPSEG